MTTAKTIIICIAAACVCLTTTFAGVSLLVLAMTLASYQPTVRRITEDVSSFNAKVDPAIQTGKEINGNIADGVKALKEFSVWRDQQGRRTR